jgi:hypothetical protein
VTRLIPPRLSALAIALVTTLAIGCADNGLPTSVDDSPLKGLAHAGTPDSGTTTPPPPPAPGDTDSTTAPPPSGPGVFRGYVRGQAEPGTGPDTMTNAPKLANVKVTAYPISQTPTDTLVIGEAAASVLTNANGEWTLPSLPGGTYAVTFVPPAGSKYRGVYAFGPLNSQSVNYPWWVVLPLK